MSSYITYQRLSFPSSEHHLILLSWCLFRHSALQGVWHILSSVLNITSFWGTNKYKRSQILKYRRNFTILFVFVSVCGELSQLLHCSSKQDWGIMCACRSLLYDVYIKGQLLWLIWNTLSCSHSWRPAGQGLHAEQRLLSLRTLCPWPHWYDMCPCACTCIAEWWPGGGAGPEPPQQWQLQLWLQSTVLERIWVMCQVCFQ